jgi:cell division septum initiation protein DivIVA
MARRITINEPAKRRSSGPVISTGRDRLGEADRPRSAELRPRFPITRRGYDRAVVDERFAELEQEVIELDRELANVQASAPFNNAATAETAGIGKQVSAILIAAHDSAEETRRLAEAEADRRIADAESRVRSLTEAPNRELMRLRDEMASLNRERDRLRDEIRAIADRLRALAETPSEDVPTESVHGSSEA